MLKIGIIGSSTISEKFCDCVNQLANYKQGIILTANYSRDIERAKSFANKFNIANSYDSKVEMFKTIDLVYIATPNKLHYEDVKLALSNRVNVICEKPLTTTAKQCEELYDLAGEGNLLLVEAIKTCPMNTYRSLLENLHLIGDIKSFRLNMMRSYGNLPTKDAQYIPNIYNKELEGGVIADLGSYALFPLIDFIYPDTKAEDLIIETIKYNSHLDVEIDITSKVRAKDNNITGLITLSMETGDNTPTYIYGENGYITIDSLSQFNTVKFFNTDDEVIKTVYRDDNHLMTTEVISCFEMINNNEHSNSTFNKEKSLKVATIIEMMRA